MFDIWMCSAVCSDISPWSYSLWAAFGTCYLPSGSYWQHWEHAIYPVVVIDSLQHPSEEACRQEFTTPVLITVHVHRATPVLITVHVHRARAGYSGLCVCGQSGLTCNLCSLHVPQGGTLGSQVWHVTCAVFTSHRAASWNSCFSSSLEETAL